MRRLWIGIVIASLAGGCAGTTELLPNSDPALNKAPAEFAADAAKRFPYHADAPRGGQALASGEAGYFLDELDLTNLSDVEWTDVEVWINGSYVVYLPRMEPKTIKKIPFRAIFNSQGQSYPTHAGAWYKMEPAMVTKVELYRDGKLYDVPVRVAE